MKLTAQLGEKEYQVTLVPDPGEGWILEIQEEGCEGNQRHEVQVLGQTGERWTLLVDSRIVDAMIEVDGLERRVEFDHRSYKVKVTSPRDRFAASVLHYEAVGAVQLKAQMPGKVITVLRRVGDDVTLGDPLVVIESMKMQNELLAPKSGRVSRCEVEEGRTVNAGDLLFEIE